MSSHTAEVSEPRQLWLPGLTPTRTMALVAVSRRVVIRFRAEAAAAASREAHRYPMGAEQIHTSGNPSPWRTYQPPPPYLVVIQGGKR